MFSLNFLKFNNKILDKIKNNRSYHDFTVFLYYIYLKLTRLEEQNKQLIDVK